MYHAPPYREMVSLMDTQAVSDDVDREEIYKKICFLEIIRYILHTIFSGSVAQLVEQKTLNLLVAGSNPARSTI